ncbi:MAG: substrate-binding domain-containing protein [Bacteroidetes bacterium]|nr:substrate-binding domain-containing protein [Bacteroidota bacterium]
MKNNFLNSLLLLIVLAFTGCDNYYKNDYQDNSPTSGQLKVFHEEGLNLHVKNQLYTFAVQYPGSKCESIVAFENECIKALYDDSCKAIMINRLLSENEKKLFAQKQLNPRYSAMAKTGVALIVNSQTKIKTLSTEQIKKLLSDELIVKDSAGTEIKLIAITDNKQSSVSLYLRDSLLAQKSFGKNCFAVESSLELIEKIANTPNAIGFLDFAWLSDKDDELYKKYQNKIHFISVGKDNTVYFEPNQSSFKTGEYPFTRTIYFIRRSEDFTLSQGLETFMAGPKGQMTFLKQGLLPARQQERVIEINMAPLNAE